MTRSQTSLDEIFETQIRTLALTLRPRTVDHYRTTARHFLGYLRAAFPQLRRLSQLRRDPHLLGWFRWLSERQPPLSNKTRSDHLIRVRRLLDDLAANGHPVQPDLFVAKTSLPNRAICPDPSPRRRINSCSRNCAEPMIWRQMRSCSPAPPESALANALICLCIAFGEWELASGRSMSHSGNCTRNV